MSGVDMGEKEDQNFVFKEILLEEKRKREKERKREKRTQFIEKVEAVHNV
jgi:hypothetical protein